VHYKTGVPRGGVWGFKPPPPEIIPKLWQCWAKFPVPWKIHLKNLIRNQVSPTCEFGGTPDWGATGPRSLFSLPSVNWICWTPPTKKFLGTPLHYKDCNDVKLRSIVCISGHLKHDTLAVHVFQKKHISYLRSETIPGIKNVYYFSNSSDPKYLKGRLKQRILWCWNWRIFRI
jgi:hypothetical protein